MLRMVPWPREARRPVLAGEDVAGFGWRGSFEWAEDDSAWKRKSLGRRGCVPAQRGVKAGFGWSRLHGAFRPGVLRAELTRAAWDVDSAHEEVFRLA